VSARSDDKPSRRNLLQYKKLVIVKLCNAIVRIAKTVCTKIGPDQGGSYYW
jgi:hypothetical protein